MIMTRLSVVDKILFERWSVFFLTTLQKSDKSNLGFYYLHKFYDNSTTYFTPMHKMCTEMLCLHMFRMALSYIDQQYAEDSMFNFILSITLLPNQHVNSVELPSTWRV